MGEQQRRVGMGPTAPFLFRDTRLVEYTHRDVTVAGLPSSLDGATIAHLSDIHFGFWIRSGELSRVVEAVNAVRPDVVLLTGDYVGYRAAPAYVCAEVLSRIGAPIYATLGNHDHWAGADEVARAFRTQSIRVLRNEWCRILLRNERVYLVGLDDMYTRNHDPERAFARLPDDGPVVFLSHIPEGSLFPQAKRAHLALSGHTHGGQVQIPGVTKYLLQKAGMNYVVGEYKLEEGPLLYVNRGLGAATIPFRLGARPEIGVFTLRKGS